MEATRFHVSIGRTIRFSRSASGFQLIELMIALGILGIVLTVALPGYAKYRDRVDNANAIAEVNAVVFNIEQFYAENHHFPNNLGEVGMDKLTDPWGNTFVYQRINGANLHGVGRIRKDKNLHPLNTDYDLCSMGKNGATTTQIITPSAKDDIIRANNGNYVGLAEDY